MKEDKLAETIADAEFNKTTSITTIIGSRLAPSYADLVQNVRYDQIGSFLFGFIRLSLVMKLFRNMMQKCVMLMNVKNNFENEFNRILT
jgi:hypothetical protein